MAPPNIPPELWINIINELGSTKYLSAYELPPDSRHALSQPCLINTAMKHLAEPVLYARLCITENTLEHLSRLLNVDEAAIKHVEGGSGGMHLQIRPKARFVCSLAIPYLNYISGAKVVLEIASILRAVRSTLSRLFINFYRSYFWAYPEFRILKAALLELSNIEEYSFASNGVTFGLELSPMASFPKIKRLMTLEVPLHYITDKIKSLPNLQVLITEHSDIRTLEEDLLRFLRAAEGLKSIVVVLDTEPATGQLDTENLSALMQRSAF
ncbi:hypothetical protein FRB94_003952 [Tulasnella sp. JGI-2019a]|nr:hypothetical protein FRB94_003952 [Tulasnella sp. JGI-2019a]KAG9008204.1 hypothetical protein FRB93_006772 [Tulasnella sp. JGI-2019a]